MGKRGFSRRELMMQGGAACFYALTARKASAAATSESSIKIYPDVEIGVIRPELHGHFAEHLGSCIYGGIWVGKNSPIPNVEGFRKQAVDWLREVGIPVLRWPGGCFADDYHWRDGIGAPEKRPKRVNIHWGNYTEDNSFGTHEFIKLCRLIGAEPYFAGNLGSGTPQELRDWVEYCNYPSGSTLADERAANGSPEPFRVRYWGVGNENWGCGGDMTANEYAAHYRRYAGYMREFGGVSLYRIACGPNGNDANWSRGFFDGLGRFRGISGFAMHFYSGGKDTPTKFTIEHMQEQLSSFDAVERAVIQQRAILDGYDPERKIGLLVDEWGVWDRSIREEEKEYGRLWQQNTIRSAVAAGLGLNAFQRQADKLVMTNIAQTVNVLHCLLLTHENHCVRTPTYHTYSLFKPHRAKTAVRVETDKRSPLDLSVSASRQGGELVLTFVNPKHDTPVRAACSLAGIRAASCTARILHGADWNAANTFDAPDRVTVRDHSATVEGSRVTIDLPPLSVATAIIKLS